MNGDGFTKFMLVLLTATVVVFGLLIVQSLDRLHRSNRQLAERLAQSRIQPPSRHFETVANSGAGSVGDPGAANYDFFDRAAEPGGRLIQALSDDIPGLNTIITNEYSASVIASLCGSSLAERNWEKPEEFQPLMAESWTISPDHLQYRIRLRRGIMWQDYTDPVTGEYVPAREVTAGDFAFYIEVIRNPDVNCAPLRSYFQDIDSIEVVNDYEFVVKWKKAFYGSMAITLGMSPLPRHYYHAYPGPFDGKKFNDDHLRNRFLIGCGPYRLDSWERDKRIVLRRNPDYFGNRLGIGPSLEYIVFEIIKLPNTRFQALISGKIDMLGLLPEQWMNRTDIPEFTSGKIRKYKYLLPSFSYIGYNQRNELFTDKRVRKALTMLVDREKIKRDIYFDLADIAVSPFFPQSQYADPDLKPLPYDPEEARKLLAEAGWRDEDGDGILEKDGRKFVFTMLQVSGHPIQQRILPLIKESMAAVGVDMKIQNVEWSVYIQRLDSRNYEACMLAWASGFDSDPYQIWHSSQIEGEGSNHISYRNPELDRLIEELRVTFDMDRRIEYSRKIARLLHDEQPYTFLFWSYSLTALSGRYRNVRVFPGGIETRIFWVPADEQLRVPGMGAN